MSNQVLHASRLGTSHSMAATTGSWSGAGRVSRLGCRRRCGQRRTCGWGTGIAARHSRPVRALQADVAGGASVAGKPGMRGDRLRRAGQQPHDGLWPGGDVRDHRPARGRWNRPSRGGARCFLGTCAVVLERNGQTIGLLADCDASRGAATSAGPASPGVARLDIDGCCAAIRALRSEVDWVIVQIHWGQEMCRLPSPDSGEVGSTVAAGPDLILGITPTFSSPASGSLAFRSSTSGEFLVFRDVLARAQ